MTYVALQTPLELREHVRSLQKKRGWHDVLVDHLFQEVCDLDADIAEAKGQIEFLEMQNNGLMEQHGRDSQELRRLCDERDKARQAAQNWKDQYLAGEAKINRKDGGDCAKGAGDAGVTVWVGSRQATQVVTKELLDLSNADELLRRFEAARAARAAQPSGNSGELAAQKQGDGNG